MYRKKVFRELSMGAEILLWFGGRTPQIPRLTASDPGFNMEVRYLTKAFRFDDGKGRGGSCSSEIKRLPMRFLTNPVLLTGPGRGEIRGT